MPLRVPPSRGDRPVWRLRREAMTTDTKAIIGTILAAAVGIGMLFQNELGNVENETRSVRCEPNWETCGANSETCERDSIRASDRART